MRHFLTVFALLILFLWTLPSNAQVTNLTVNGTSSNFTMASGDAVTWQYNLPNGATANVEFWLDLNNNGAIDPGADKIFAAFTQTDGDPNGNDGPPDMDGSANGQIFFSQPVGLAPEHYIFRATEGTSGETVVGTVTPLLSPNATISGTVTPPAGASKANIIVEANKRSDSTSNNGGDIFWDALTDTSGFYTINIHVDTTTTYWRVSVLDDFSPSVSSPTEVLLTLHGDATGIDFTYLAAAAKVSGHLYDELHAPVSNVDMAVSSDTGNISRYTRTDTEGFFEIGLLPSDLDGRSWHLQTTQSGMSTTTMLQSRSLLGVIIPGDSLYRELTLYSTNAQIEGHIRVNGNPPGYQLQVSAMSGDSVMAYVWSDSATGDFLIPVSDKIASYDLFAWPPPWNSSIPSLTAQPGDTGVVINFTTTAVIERGSGIPDAFALGQNYPNPFNPSTGIRYDLPTASRVTLKVYDVLGREVESLMDEDQEAGSYTVQFDASGLTSGVYFYRLTAGRYVATQKMLLMK